jgi:high-affinity nickel permease
MNGSLLFVLCLVTIVLFTNIVHTMVKQRKRAPKPDEEVERTLARIDLLEERIKVLERIITENRFDLKEEIDSL